MTDTESTEKQEPSTRDAYHRRRTVEAGETTDIQIIHLEQNQPNRRENRLDELEQKSQNVENLSIDIYFDVAGEVWKTTISSIHLSAIADAAHISVPFFTVDNLIGKSVPAVFKDSMDAAVINETNISMSLCKEQSVSEVKSQSLHTDDFNNLQRYVALSHSYENQQNNNGWVCVVESVTEIDDEKLRITANTGTEHDISWRIELPKTTEENADHRVRLIENVGHGDPFFIENEDIVIVHKKDADTDLSSVATDTTDTWLLVTPSDFTKWNEDNHENNVQTSTQSTTKTHSRTNTTEQKHQYDIGDYQTKLFAYSLFMLVTSQLAPRFIPSSTPTTSRLMIERMIQFSEAVAVIFAVLIVFLQIIKYQLHKQQSQ